jgi:hypothetical protein
MSKQTIATITKEIKARPKEDFYFKRTLEHIHRVQNNMLTVVTEFRDQLGLDLETCRQLMFNVFKHDRSKFNGDQFQPYIDFSWYKHTGEELTEEQEDAFAAAWKNHYMEENHHTSRVKENHLMKQHDYFEVTEAIEMACDMQAMSQEFGEGVFEKFYLNVEQAKAKENLGEENFIEADYWILQVLECFKKKNIKENV